MAWICFGIPGFLTAALVGYFSWDLWLHQRWNAWKVTHPGGVLGEVARVDWRHALSALAVAMGALLGTTLFGGTIALVVLYWEVVLTAILIAILCGAAIAFIALMEHKQPGCLSMICLLACGYWLFCLSDNDRR